MASVYPTSKPWVKCKSQILNQIHRESMETESSILSNNLFTSIGTTVLGFILPKYVGWVCSWRGKVNMKASQGH